MKDRVAVVTGANRGIGAEIARVLARELAGDPRRIRVNAENPGWVRTRMGGQGAPRSVEEGARTAVWLATLPGDGPSGGFFRDDQAIPW